MSSRVDVLFNFGISVFGRVRVRGIVTGLGVSPSPLTTPLTTPVLTTPVLTTIPTLHGDDHGKGDSDYEEELQQVFSNIDSNAIESTNDYGDDDNADGSSSTNTNAVILSNGQTVVFGLVVHPPSDWAKGGKDVDEFFALFQKYRDFLFFSYSLDDGTGDDNYDYIHNSNDNKVIPITTSMHHINKPNVDLSRQAPIRVQQIRRGVLITHVCKLQLRPSLIGKDIMLSLSLILSLSASEHITSTTSTTTLENAIIQEEREIRKLLELNRYHPPGIPERNVAIKIRVIDSLNLSISTQELNQKSCIVVLKLSNIHPSNTIYISDTTILLNHTRLDWKSFLDSIEGGNEVIKREDGTDTDDFDDTYSEGASCQSMSDYQNSIHVDDFFPAHLYFDIKQVCSAADKGTSTSDLFLKIEPHCSHNLVYIITLKEVDTHKVVKLPATHFTTPCVIEWSHCQREQLQFNNQQHSHISTLITQDSFSWSCASTLISSDYKYLLLESAKARLHHEELGERAKASAKASTVVKVTISQSPAHNCNGSPMKLVISLENITHEDLGRFQLFFERNPQSVPLTSIPFIIQENSIIVNGLKARESVTINITILPLRSGNLVLDGLKMRMIEKNGSDGFLSLAHSFQTYVYEK